MHFQACQQWFDLGRSWRITVCRDAGVTPPLALFYDRVRGLLPPVLSVGIFLQSLLPRALFQKLNHYFYRGFFLLLGLLMPGLTIRIDPALRRLRGAVVVSNHHSYLDPLMFQSIFCKTNHHREEHLLPGADFRVVDKERRLYAGFGRRPVWRSDAATHGDLTCVSSLPAE
jgi:hypothetical protein